MDLPLLTAFFADTIKANLEPGGSETYCFLQLLCQGTIYRQLKISYAPTPFADEVVMRRYFRLEPVEAASKIQFADETLFFQHSKVSIDRSKAQIGELLADLLVYPLRGRMALRLSEDFQNSLTLPGFASSSSHRHLLIGTVLDYPSSFFACQ